MADILSSRGRGNPRIDLTPMVDLGFLLITFFIFTTTLSERKSMEIIMPSEAPAPPTEIPHHTALSLYLLGKNKVLALYGKAAMETDFSSASHISTNTANIREQIQEAKSNMQAAIATGIDGSKGTDRLFVLIKPSTSCTYEDVVNILDEMQINGVSDYTLLDATVEEEMKMAALQKTL